MKEKYYQTKKFQALHKKWMKKLKDSGFKDIETVRQIEQNYCNRQRFNADIQNMIGDDSWWNAFQEGQVTNVKESFKHEVINEGQSFRAKDLVTILQRAKS